MGTISAFDVHSDGFNNVGNPTWHWTEQQTWGDQWWHTQANTNTSRQRLTIQGTNLGLSIKIIPRFKKTTDRLHLARTTDQNKLTFVCSIDTGLLNPPCCVLIRPSWRLKLFGFADHAGRWKPLSTQIFPTNVWILVIMTVMIIVMTMITISW